MDEQVIFTTNNTGSVASIHSFEQSTLRQCTVGSRNSAVRVGDKYLFVAQAQKALINVYNLSGPHKRESVEQRLPLPEVLSCLATLEDPRCDTNHKIPDFNVPYLLLGSTGSGKLYIWELNSGILLGVKPLAHYQAITKIQSILQGKYIVTSGADARVIIWQTSDLVSMSEPKPVCILHDHTLPVTDFQVSSTNGDFLSLSGTKLFTVSEDGTLRCYDLSSMARSKTSQPTLIATFTLPLAITALTLDPADRACYIGTAEGCFSLQLFYKLSGSKLVNLVQLSDGKARIFSLTESSMELKATQDREKLYAIGQLLCEKVSSTAVTCFEISMDGTLLLVGDSEGKVSVTEIYSKQILRTMQPISTSQTIHGGVTNLIIDTQLNANQNEVGADSAKVSPNAKIPSLQRVIFDSSKPGQLHDIFHQVGEENGSTSLCLDDFDAYADQLRSQQSIISQSNGAQSTVLIAEQEPSKDSSAKDQEIADLKDNVESLKSAYKELRELHEKLYQEHEKLLETTI
ncbi:chromatin-binding/pre-rRNA-processing protein IPI3 TDEL_0A01140 [Torulaspora delbrueckii]|uniref:Pre-rRNA-processing protein IPI3 n=1 Tax=Torulaspora delbrueckii TaxID=4950 RepID=G8ZLF2_TORDE|nr:hypothetical protein TDEL_0A01140 [Torulaspora delbrueckii]CCE89446.1 hypothetical protein TDEL_0A01140 [Torulaspora delbrueckii]